MQVPGADEPCSQIESRQNFAVSRRTFVLSLGAMAGALVMPDAFARARDTRPALSRGAEIEIAQRVKLKTLRERVTDRYNVSRRRDIRSKFGTGRNGHAAERLISVYNTHTGESVSTPYWVQGRYRISALRQLSHVMRDHHNNLVHPIDPQLLDLMVDVQASLGQCGTFHVMSAYRSPETNARLGRHNRAVAEHSMHVEGRAVDLWLPGCALHDLHRAAVALRGGGVGYYPDSNFVHMDTGKVRYWGA